VRLESAEAVAEAWGVDLATAEAWKSLCKQPRKRKKQSVSSPPIVWKAADDQLLGAVTMSEVARLTGRTVTAVRKRRRALGLPDGRLAAQRAQLRTSLEMQAEATSLAVRQHTAALGESLALLRKTYVQAKASAAYWHARQDQPRPGGRGDLG
jgi:hypothetical protein